ncbi:MAG: DUF1015 domain-containing protein [Anaerolineae bacterium]|nr:DUF1015 domain-containing protein [Anaerolineae bacterium]
MATIRPFRGVRYNTGLVDPSAVISQPYDRVRYGLQERYYARSPYSVVRLIKGAELPGDRVEDPAGPNAYTRARDTYGAWRAENVLVREAQAAIYVYHQSFPLHGRETTRRAFIAAFALTRFDKGIVLPHERTHAGPIADRLRLTRTTGLNMGQVFVLYPDAAQRVRTILDDAIAGRAPDLEARELYESDVRQQLWVVHEPETIDAVAALMAPMRHLIIADGHHRYETALAYRDEMRARHPAAPPEAAFNHCMATFVGMDDPGLSILATHREVFGLPHVSLDEILSRAQADWSIAASPDLEACLAAMRAREQAHAFGLYARGQYHVLTLRNGKAIERWITEPRSAAWKSLDVTIAHRLLLEHVVGLPAEAAERAENLRYHRDAAGAVASVDAGRGDLVVLLNPTRIEQVKACAEAGDKMPQKSTDFYPKVVAGLTILPVDAEERL